MNMKILLKELGYVVSWERRSNVREAKFFRL